MVTTQRLGAYGRVLDQPVLRRLLPGVVVSALGDGMSMVAVAWLAVQLAPPGQRGVWTGAAVAAYALPGTLGAAVLGPLVRRLGSLRLVQLDAALRAVALGAIPVLAAAGLLRPVTYVALLAASSLLSAWGHAGAYTLVADLLPAEDRIAGNALLSASDLGATVVGPLVAGLLAAVTGPAWVIGADAASFALLAVAARFAAGRLPHRTPAPPGPETAGGWRTIRGYPRLLGLLVVTCFFNFLYGPVEVALPVHIADELHGSARLLGAFWTAFGVGAVVGGLSAGRLRHRALWTVVVGIIVGWGLALLPLGLTDAVLPGLVGFAFGGLVYGPWAAVTTTLFQHTSPPAALSRVLAVRRALTTPSTALGTLLGGPAVGALGGRQTVLASALLTLALGGVTGAVMLARGRRGMTRSAS